MSFDTTAYVRLDARRASARQHPARRSRRRPATCSKCPATGRACSGCAWGQARSPTTAWWSGGPGRAPSRSGEGGAWKFTAGETTLEIAATPLARTASRSRCAGRRVDHRRAFAASRGCRRSAAYARAGSGPRPSRSLRANPCTASARNSVRSTSAASWSIRRSSTRWASTPDWRTRTRRSHGARAPARARGACSSTRRRRSPTASGIPTGRTARTCCRVDDEALDLFLFAADAPAGILDLYTQLTGRAAVGPAVGPRPVGVARHYKTPEEAAAVAAKLRARRIPCDVLTLDGRAAWKAETRFDFKWDPDRFPDPRAALAAIKAHDLRVCVWEYPYVSVHSPLFAELASRGYLLTTADGDPYVFGWDTAPGAGPFGNVLTPLPESGIVDFTHPGAYVVVARRARGAVRRRRRRDQERFRRAGSRRRRRLQRRSRPPAAQRLPAAVQPVRLRRDGEVPARPRRRRRWSGAAPAGPAASAIRSSGAAIRKATGRASPRRSAAACRGA